MLSIEELDKRKSVTYKALFPNFNRLKSNSILNQRFLQ